jgi:hypothetical protein
MGALVGAFGVAALVRRSRPPVAALGSDVVVHRRELIEPRRPVDRAVSLGAGLIALITAVTVIWFAIEGLRQGFLPA